MMRVLDYGAPGRMPSHCSPTVTRPASRSCLTCPQQYRRVFYGRLTLCAVVQPSDFPSDDRDAKASATPVAGVDLLNDSTALTENFCLIESRDSVKDFAMLNLKEIETSIEARRNKIFLLMEEVRRLRIQQKIKEPDDKDVHNEKYPSALPFLPPLSDKTLKTYYTVYAGIVALIILFGGLLAPIAEVRLGLGGTSYADFIRSMHLPGQLADVDPIVASFCGGAVGVLSALLVVEVNNAESQAKRRCIYCEGIGYLTCGNCLGNGRGGEGERCSYCSGTGKVMCTSCLCTGKQMATEHDPRIDPFD